MRRTIAPVSRAFQSLIAALLCAATLLPLSTPAPAFAASAEQISYGSLLASLERQQVKALVIAERDHEAAATLTDGSRVRVRVPDDAAALAERAHTAGADVRYEDTLPGRGGFPWGALLVGGLIASAFGLLGFALWHQFAGGGPQARKLRK